MRENTQKDVPKFEPYEYTISKHWVYALEYGPDEADLTDEEREQLEEWSKDILPGHWSFDMDEEPSFQTDEISGLKSDCITATRMVNVELAKKLEGNSKNPKIEPMKEDENASYDQSNTIKQ